MHPREDFARISNQKDWSVNLIPILLLGSKSTKLLSKGRFQSNRYKYPNVLLYVSRIVVE